MQRLQQQTSPTLQFGIAALIGSVVAADLLTPLGLAVWVAYILPMGACLYTRSPNAPLYVVSAATAATIYSAFQDPGSVVAQWVGLLNRAMCVVALWPLAHMVRSLMLVRQASEREEWLRRVQVGLLESLQGELPPQAVADRTLRGLVETLDAQVGVLYLSAPGGALERTASHALYGEGAPARLAPGEGLIGQAALTGKIALLRDVPPAFLHMQSGVGDGAPRQVLIAPLRADGHTVAVLALGSMHPLHDLDRELLGRVAEPVAMALASARNKARLRDLLEESQRQAEELQAQQSELEAQQAELEATNSDLNQTNALIEAHKQELEQQRDALSRARELADQASRHKSEFLANMSHELRTPLNSALILSRLLADNKQGNLTPDQVRSAETIYEAGNDLLLLINDILDLAKIEAGRVDLVHEKVSLEALCAGLEKSFRPLADQKALRFAIGRAPEAPGSVWSDARRLEQVLKNLLSNALKFTERGEVELAIGADAHSVRFAVRDTGIGIAAAQQEVIFEAFRQADGTTSRRFGGTGLGLSISRQLARLLGGRLEVQSAPGQGSTFTLVIPCGQAEAPAPARKPPAIRPRSAAGVRVEPAPVSDGPLPPPAPDLPDDRDHLTRPGRLILVVEDDLAFARILCDLAHELDFDCVAATTAEQGLALARRLQPSGILLDVGLPDVSGLTLLEQLKRDPDARHIPIHMVSVDDHAQLALELGAVGYALKPVAREELVSALGRLEQQHARRVRRVLLVEDDPRQQESVLRLLARDGVEIALAGTVEAALAELERHSVDCMVLDLALPDGTGVDLLERLAEGPRYSFPPAIVYTGRELDRAEEERLRRYSRSIILKGARSPERLLDEVTLFLHQVESNLPAEQRRMLAQARRHEDAFRGRRVLVVEDDVRTVFALTRVLEPRGARVEIARNGREALDALERVGGVDLVLMDLMMPEMDGLTAIRRIRERGRWKELPIIALTAKAMADDREQALAAGASDYLAKPIDIDKLVSLCRVWLPR